MGSAVRRVHEAYDLSFTSTRNPGKRSKSRKVVREMKKREDARKFAETVTVANDCGTRIYRCDAKECYMVGYCVPGSTDQLFEAK